VPQLESLDGRVVPALVGKIKIDFAVANPDVPAHVSTLPPPAVGLAAPPAGSDGLSGPTGPVQVPGGSAAGFERASDGGGWLNLKTGEKFHEYGWGVAPAEKFHEYM
jgi:hypothetical protein